MRITILSGSVPTTTFIDALINTIAEEGFDITVIGKKTGVYQYHKNVKVLVVPDSFIGRIVFIKKLLLLTGFKHFGKIVRQSKGWKGLYHDLLFYLPIIYSRPDSVHLQWTAFVHDRDLLFDLFKDKILVSLRGAHINYTPITTPAIKESYLRLFPKVHRFHAVCEAIEREAEQYGVRKEKTDVIYSMVNDNLLQKDIHPKEQKEHLHIISVGRFFWKKGYEYAIDALAVLKHKGIPFKYTLIAEGKTPAAITYQLYQLGLTNDVQIINGTEHSDVLTLIERHDVLLLPSVEEGIANVVLEAMAVGTPVITTDVGGMKETVQNNVTGYVVPVRDVYAMTNALEQFSKLDKEERFIIATAAKKVIAGKHNREVFIERFRKFYQQ